ncbi:DNA-3-methyladenine glycosylase 2 family protein [Alteromonas aestuariivivens]|uniref:DNA-3-methyladenine glycosylase 2 family protein n=1 Tax=Alteromonas aestuariivivens TaxID=1938339 RepID=A0A3D8M9Y8_9ALTE|nr:AlkA N-terminal domain-containing protein [Alteromonas aestuariivivens]RDV26837.1 DNA-3-methyladenine glycosylase 2 family protein [Alteromonas aestuariivivens]
MATTSVQVSEQQRACFREARLSRDRRFDGQFFVAVKSTGIFCRNVCPARLPTERNVEYFPMAVQAMQAGFRPCLRCRPDSAPGSSAWLGVNTTVIRAQKLLSELPPQPIHRVADRLGISERYLHSLLRRHLGLSPKAFQVFHQLLFAKTLLQQSTMPITDIAQVCGFDSIRRLQVLMQKYWQLAPSKLRRQGLGAEQAQVDSEFRLAFCYRPPYDWDWVRRFWERRQIEACERFNARGYQRTFIEQGVAGHVAIEHCPQRNEFKVKLSIDDVRFAHAVLERVRRVLDLDADPCVIDAALARAGIAAERRLAGLRIPGVWSVFEAGCRAILGQQVSVKAAISHLNLLVNTLGENTAYGVAFPMPERVAADELIFLRMPQRRKDALRDYARICAQQGDGEPDDNTVLQIAGVGPWTLNYIRLRGRSQPDVYLGGDLIVQKQAAALDLAPDCAAPWRSYLTLQLWRLADEEAAFKEQ